MSYTNLMPPLNDTRDEAFFDSMSEQQAIRAIDKYYTSLAEQQTAGWLKAIEKTIEKAPREEVSDTLRNALLNLIGYIREKCQRVPEQI